MNARPAVLCPVDFSDASRAALKYANAIAAHFGGRLVVLTVEDPLLTEVMDLGAGAVWDPEDARLHLSRFTFRTLGAKPPKSLDVDFQVAVGKPAQWILHIARAQQCDLIVMSSHGLTGARKMFFGSTTERVLRETTVPVLVTSPDAEGPESLEALQRTVRRILVPVDLTSASPHQVGIARGLSDALNAPMLVTYVIEPVRSPLAAKLHLPSVEIERKARAEDGLAELMATVPKALNAEALVGYGDPAEEIAKIARDRQTGLIVIGLHGSPAYGPRMGSVTYRVICLAHGLVLALPPIAAQAASATDGDRRSEVIAAR
jgi:universal stress protein A